MLVHKQTTPSSAWVITHSEAGNPSVSVTVVKDGKSMPILPLNVFVIDANTIRIEFSTPMIGTAMLRSGGV